MNVARGNLLNRLHYTPYCGGERCMHGMPRTAFDGSRFACCCGWRSGFEPEFIERYRAAQAQLSARHVRTSRRAAGGRPRHQGDRMIGRPFYETVYHVDGWTLADGADRVIWSTPPDPRARKLLTAAPAPSEP